MSSNRISLIMAAAMATLMPHAADAQPFTIDYHEPPGCDEGGVLICDAAVAEILGLCDEPDPCPICVSALPYDEEDCCVWYPTEPPDDCGGDPPEPRPCPRTVQGLVERVLDNAGGSISVSNELAVLDGMCYYLYACCESNGLTVDDAVAAFYYLLPDSTYTEDTIRSLLTGCSKCEDPDEGPDDPDPEGPFPPGGDWPNGVFPGDGPPRDDSVGGGNGSSNRGGRCSDVSLSGSPSFELFGNDPAECAGGSSVGIFDIDLYSGQWAKQTVDLALPAKGFGWVISRSYNGTQQVLDTGDYVFVHSNGMQGYDWRQDSLPHLVHVDAATTESLYLVMNAQSFLTFGRAGKSDSDIWVPTGSKGGAALVIDVSSTLDSVDYEIIEVYDLTGLKMSFFSPMDTSIDDSIRGQLWKIEDPAGNVAYVGDATDPGAAMDDGFVEVGTSTGDYAIESVYDTSGRLYEYEYSSSPIDEDTVNGAHRLISITAYPEDDNTDPYVAKVEYDYYDYESPNTPEPFGLPGDLKLVTVRTPTSISGDEVVERTLYRYWVDGEDGDDPGSGADGYDHAIKYIYNPEGMRRADIELTTEPDVLDESLSALQKYAAQYMEYNVGSYDRRVKLVWGNGECGCSGASVSGTHELAYDSYFDVNALDPGSSGWQPWFVRTVITFPTALASEKTTVTLERFETHYFGLGGSRIATVVSDDEPSTASDFWVTLTEFDFQSLGAEQYTPAAISAYSHSGGTFTKSASTGLVYQYIPWELSEVGSGVDERNYGRTRFIGWKEGSGGSIQSYLSEVEHEFAEATIEGEGGSGPTDIEVVLSKPYVLRTQRYPDGGTSTDAAGYEETTFDRSFYTNAAANSVDSLRVESETIEQPLVPTAENGDNTSDDPVTTYYRLDGTVSWVEEADGIFSYTKYDDFNMPSMSIQDADPANGDVTGDLPPGGLTATGTPLHIKTIYEYDNQMRLTTMTLPHGRKMYEHYDVLDNGLIVILSFPEATVTTVSGPASFVMSGHNGAVYQRGAVAISSAVLIADSDDWVVETEVTGHIADIATVFDDMELGVPVRLSESVYDEPGDKMLASRIYYDIDGTVGNQYDETTYGYDDMGRMVRTEAPHGTITRMTYDGIGRPVAQWMGTDDDDFPDGSGSSDNMVMVSSTVYDGGNVGNGLVSKSIRYVDDDVMTDDDRETEYLYDERDRMIVQLNPLAPHSVYEYDNLGRVIYTAMYSDDLNIDESTQASMDEDDRVSLMQTMYDTRGRVFESRMYEIVQSTGAKDGASDYLFNRMWYDSVGQTVKTTGRSLTKTTYDRLRRPTAVYSLSSTNDSAYADADDVTGDTVVSETHTLWDDDSGLVMAAMQIDRHPEDTSTTGPLYDPASPTSDWDEGDITGRVQISAMWYDEQDRMIETVDYGTAGLDSTDTSESFDRLDSAYNSPPTPTALIGSSEIGHFVINAYNDDGEVEVVSVPNDDSDDWVVLTKTVYDDAGRVVQRIENWDENASPTPSLPDVNRITEMVYEDGLLKFQFAKNAKDGPSVETQATRYTYGSTKGGSASDVATGHLLTAVHYPDATEESGAITSGHTTDAVFYLYNAQGQRRATKDQAGNVIAIEFDDRGRTTKRRVTTLDADFDGYVRRIETAYDDRGLLSSVKQYSADTGGTLRDSVDFTYDNWGNLETSDQDPDGSSSFVVEYTHVRSLGEISRLRRIEVDYPSTALAEYAYVTGMDANLSRVSRVRFDAASLPPTLKFPVDIAQYTYGGAANLLKTIVFDSGQNYHTSYYDTADADGYLYLDDFNRPKQSYWAHGTATSGMKFFEADLFYDKASNITDIDDQVTGRNMTLTVDDFRRLTQSDVGSNTESWAYDHLGNWQTYEYDDGDGDYDQPLEILDERLFNRANEMSDRDISLGMSPQTPAARDPIYDENGNMTDDGRFYKYTYDAFGRITAVSDGTNTVAEYRYNGLFQRIVTKTDRDGSSGLSGEDEYYHIYDDRWRVIEIWRKASGGSLDSYPKEVTVYHAAGLGGSSSPLDSVIARYRSDEGSMSGKPYDDWDEPATGTMDKRSTYFQNWRGDVVFVRGHETTERIDYTPYGIPLGYVAADQNRDGVVSGPDNSKFSINAGASNPMADLNFDGAVDGSDTTAFASAVALTAGTVGGAHVLSPWMDSHIGYAGYRLTDQTQTTVWHVRYREFVPELGVWTRRDPIGYVNGYGLYEYVMSSTILGIDPMGLACAPCGCQCGSGSGGSNSSRRSYDEPNQQRLPSQDPSFKPSCNFPTGKVDRKVACKIWTLCWALRLGSGPKDECWKEIQEAGMSQCIRNNKANAIEAMYDAAISCRQGKKRLCVSYDDFLACRDRTSWYYDIFYWPSDIANYLVEECQKLCASTYPLPQQQPERDTCEIACFIPKIPQRLLRPPGDIMAVFGYCGCARKALFVVRGKCPSGSGDIKQLFPGCTWWW